MDKVDWISPLDRITAVHDANAELVQVYEEHSRQRCRGAAAWSAFHYQRAGGVVISSWRDGPRDVFLLKEGVCGLKLIPSISPAGIESVTVDDGKIILGYAGLGGGGVGIARCRAESKGVLDFETLNPGGGGELGKASITVQANVKVTLGIDDTDREGEGATWSLANEIGVKLEEEGLCIYLDHTLVQLYPKAPEKTANCVATALTFAVPVGTVDGFVERAKAILKESTLSSETGMAVLQGIELPANLMDFANEARAREVIVEEALTAAGAAGADAFSVTGKNGIIGAVAALGYAEMHESAVDVWNGQGPQPDSC